MLHQKPRQQGARIPGHSARPRRRAVRLQQAQARQAQLVAQLQLQQVLHLLELLLDSCLLLLIWRRLGCCCRCFH